MTKSEREEREYKNLFCDEKHAKKAWRDIIGTALESNADKLPPLFDKNENLTRESMIEELAYKMVEDRLKEEGKSRKPMNAELIVASAIVRARYQDTTLNTLLDRTAGKVKEELSVDTSPYDDLTTEELELLVEYRKTKRNEDG